MAKATKTASTSTQAANGAAQARIRLSVNKAYKMYVGGAFVRSESGRYFQVTSAKTKDSADPETVNIPLGSRKDVRDAVLIAKNAFEGWQKRTAYNRGQILYRLAEVMESRRPELVASLVRAGSSEAQADHELNTSIDRVVYYAGLCDKLSALLASHNPVAGPHFGFTLPEASGVIGAVAPDSPALLGLVSVVLPIITGGNVVVTLASETDPRTAIVFCECLATSDVPSGVVNVLTGKASEIAPQLAKHREVNGVDIWSKDTTLRTSLEADGAESVKRVRTRVPATALFFDEKRGQGLGWVEPFLESKTVWHPAGI